jgi:cytochrome P450
MGSKEPLIPLDLDGEEQRLFRRLLDPLFSPRAVEPIRPEIRTLTDELIDTFIADGRTDLFASFCQPLPSKIFMGLLGLPQEDMEKFLAFKDAVIRPEGDTFQEMAAYTERAGEVMTEYLHGIFDAREASGALGDDLIGGFLAAEVDGRKLTRSEITRIVYLLVIAGLDTVAASLSCILAWFAKHPEERAEVIADPSLLPEAIEELMRFESPVHMGHRHVTEDFELNGWSFRAGEMVEVAWASANVDPEVFENPLQVDLGRKRNAHIGFASGPHRCLGSNLARMELVTVIEQFHRRIPEYAISPGQKPMYVNYGVRLAAYLPVSFPEGEKAS